MDAKFVSDLNTMPAEKICPYAGRTSSEMPHSHSPEVSIYSLPSHSGSRSSHETSTQPTSAHSEEKKRCPVIFTQEVDPQLIKTSIEDRIAYLTDFLNFTSRDSDVIKKVAPHVGDLIPALVDDLYAKLFEFDITKKIFMTRNQVRTEPL